MEEDQQDAVARLIGEATAEEENKNSNIEINGNNIVIGNSNSVVITEKHINITINRVYRYHHRPRNPKKVSRFEWEKHPKNRFFSYFENQPKVSQKYHLTPIKDWKKFLQPTLFKVSRFICPPAVFQGEETITC